MPESPKYSLSLLKYDKARQSMHQMARINQKELIFSEHDFEFDTDFSVASPLIEEEDTTSREKPTLSHYFKDRTIV